MKSEVVPIGSQGRPTWNPSEGPHGMAMAASCGCQDRGPMGSPGGARPWDPKSVPGDWSMVPQWEWTRGPWAPAAHA